jgi:acetoin utilization protein AcuB
MDVREVMTRDVKSTDPRTTVEEAKRIMRRGRFRRLPIVDNGQLVGIVAESDMNTASDHTSLGTIMHSPVITVEPDDPIEQAGRLMLEHKISVLPVVEHDSIVGILTESDLFEALCAFMGVTEPSSRVEVVMEDSAAALSAIMEVLKRHDIRVVSLNSAPPRETGTRRLVLRLATMRPEPLFDDFRATGATVISALEPGIKDTP